MAAKRHKPEEIVTTLRQVEVLVGQGIARIDAIWEVRITEQTFYRWRKQYAGMGTAQLKELKHLQKENGEYTTIQRDRTVHWATVHLPRRPSFRWIPVRSCTNIQTGLLNAGRPSPCPETPKKKNAVPKESCPRHRASS